MTRRGRPRTNARTRSPRRRSCRPASCWRGSTTGSPTAPASRFRASRPSRRSKGRSGSVPGGASSTVGIPARRPAPVSVSVQTARSRSAPTRPEACASSRADAPDNPVDTLTFTSAPLASDQVLLGHASLTFRATLDATDAHFYVELFEVDAATVTRRGSTTDTSPRATGVHTPTPSRSPSARATSTASAIRAHHYRFRAGSRVRIRVGGGPASKLTPPPAPVTVTMETGPTAVCDSRASRTITDRSTTGRSAISGRTVT